MINQIDEQINFTPDKFPNEDIDDNEFD